MEDRFDMTPKEFYDKFVSSRSSYETMAERISKMTLPYVFTSSGFSSSSKLDDEIAQSYCGRLVNTLKAKMGMSLLPPSTSSFRLEPNAEALMQLTQGDANANAEIGAIISTVTANINKEIEAQQIRDKIFDMILQLIVVGSCIIEKKDKDGLIIHTLRNYTIDLDSNGEVRGLCVSEKIKDLPEGITVSKEEDEYTIYTLVQRNADDNKWYMKQSIGDEIVGKEQSFNDTNCPFQYVGWTFVQGDTYHRPYAEDYIDDMESYNSLAKLLTQGSIIAAKTLLLVDQRGNRTKIADVAKSSNGDVINGNAADITAFQLGKNYDFQIPMERLADIGRNLASAFLMNESVTRDAERVTAQEIRFMAQELETSSLSGIYSKLAKKVSKRIVEWVMDEMGIKMKEIGVNIITGLDALGRSQEAQKMDMFIQRLGAMGLISWVNTTELISRYAAYDGIETTNLIKTPAQMQQEQQAQQQAMAQQTAQQSAAQAGGEVAGQQMAQQGMV